MPDFSAGDFFRNAAQLTIPATMEIGHLIRLDKRVEAIRRFCRTNDSPPLTKRSGYGRKSVKQVCKKVGVAVEGGLRRLKVESMKVSAEGNIRENSRRNQTEHR